MKGVFGCVAIDLFFPFFGLFGWVGWLSVLQQSPRAVCCGSEPIEPARGLLSGKGVGRLMGLSLSRTPIVNDFLEFEFSAAVVARWRALIRHCHRIRRLQRVWGVLGGFLHYQVPARLRDRLLATWPQSVPPLALTNV